MAADVVGIAGTDADDKNLSHLQESSTINRRGGLAIADPIL